MGMAGGFLTNPVLSALQASMGIGAPALGGMSPGGAVPGAAAPAAPEPTNTTDVHLNGHEAAKMAAGATRMEKADGKVGARDFSFLVTEDEQESGPNLSLLDDESGSGSDSGEEGEPGNDEEGEGYDPGSALDQLLWRQKAVSGMEVRRPGESVQQFFQRRTAGMRMLKAEAGGAEAKQLENEVDQALMNANTAWHWGQGDNDADLSDDEKELVKQLDAPQHAHTRNPPLAAPDARPLRLSSTRAWRLWAAGHSHGGESAGRWARPATASGARASHLPTPPTPHSSAFCYAGPVRDAAAHYARAHVGSRLGRRAAAAARGLQLDGRARVVERRGGRRPWGRRAGAV